MAIDALRAAQTYAEAAKIAAGAAPGISEAEKPSFVDMVKSAAAEAIQAVATGEEAAAAVAAGKADLVEVVAAISAAEVSLETAIAVRNRVIEAYQEIMRMPI